MSRAHHRRRKAEQRTHQDRRRSKPPPLKELASEAINEGHPSAILDLGSSLVSLMDPRRRTFDEPEEPPMSPAGFIEASLMAADLASLALGWVVGMLTHDRASMERIEDLLRMRGRSLPPWLSNLEPIEVADGLLVTHVLGDSETILLRVKTGNRDEFALHALVDHNMGGALKEAFLVTRSWDRVKKIYRIVSRDPDVTVASISPADACARIREANTHFDRIYPPITTDTWPATQPLMEWVVDHVTEQGRGYEYPEWDEAAREAIKEEFLASPFSAGFEPEDVDWIDTLLWFGCDYGPADPYRWSPTSVEILLLNWIPRKIMEEVEYLERAPRVLDSFIRFAHARKGLRRGVTARVINALEDSAMDYRQIIRTDRPQGPLALLAQAGWYQYESQNVEEGPEEVYRDVSFFARQDLARQVGGYHELASLDLSPLLPAPIPWEDIDPELKATIEEIDTLCQRCATELLDEEIAAACRLLLTDLAREAGAVLGRGQADRTAAAIVWVIGRINRVVGYGRQVAARDLFAWFGLKGSASTRAGSLVKALDFDYYDLSRRETLGTSRYLTSTTRRNIGETFSQHGKVLRPVSSADRSGS